MTVPDIAVPSTGMSGTSADDVAAADAAGAGVRGSTVNGRPVPDAPDLERMRRDRHQKLAAQLEASATDALVVLNASSVAYATGARAPGADSARASLMRVMAILVAGDPVPHLFTPYPEGAPPELDADHLHGPLRPDLDDAMPAMAAALAELVPAGATIAVDEQTHPMMRALAGYEWAPASQIMGAVKLCKTADELACIRAAQRINELAMCDVAPLVRPGTSQTDLSAVFLRRIFELGASSNGIDPIWQVMPRTRAAGVWTTHGDLAFPTATTDRLLREGDVVWCDSGLHLEGYSSDFGRTWIASRSPAATARQRAQCARWRSVVDAVRDIARPGVTALELGRGAVAAHDGGEPWLDHFYLAHGVGTDSAEMPLIGTDLGEDFDDRMVMAPGMVLVIEPVIWDDGAAGYRAEDIVAITDDGWLALSDFPYDPYEEVG